MLPVTVVGTAPYIALPVTLAGTALYLALPVTVVGTAPYKVLLVTVVVTAPYKALPVTMVGTAPNFTHSYYDEAVHLKSVAPYNTLGLKYLALMFKSLADLRADLMWTSD